MRNYSYMISQFTFYDRTGIRKMLEEKAEKGWLLDRISNFRWRFRRIEPRKVHYSVTYFPKASAYDPGPTEGQLDLQEFCAHSGWTLAGTSAQMQIFYNLSENPVPIETDPLIELENIHRSAKKNYLPAYILLFLLVVIQIAMQIGQIMTFPLTYLSQNTTLFNFLCQAVLVLMCGMEIVGYVHWYRRAKRAAENGEFVETHGFRKVQLFLLGLVLISLVILLATMKPRFAAVMVSVFVMLFAVVFGIMGLHQWMKRRGVTRETNRLVTILICLVLTMAVCGLSVTVLVRLLDLPAWEESRVAGTYEWNGISFDIYQDDIPLRVEDLMDVTSPDYSYEAREQGSFLLYKGDYSQRIWGSSDLPEMSYIVYTTKLPAVYDLCVKKATESKDYPTGVDTDGNEYYDTYVLQDPAPWGAEAVYRKYIAGEAYDHYVLCYENKVVIFQPNWEPTAEQMAKIGEVFGK